MAFCPECGKSVTAEASKCASCGHELEAKPAGAKTGPTRFKGTMLMATAPVIAKAGPGPAADKPAADKAPAAAPVAVTPAAGPANQQAAPAPTANAQAKSTMIGTGLGTAVGGPVANALKPAVAAAAAAKPAAPVARAAAPNVGGAAPKSTVLGAGVAPFAAAAAAHAAPAAAAPIAASAAGAVAQVIAARPTGQAAAKPDDAKRNLAYAQTQHQGAFAAASQAALAAAGPAAAVPRTSPNLAPAAAEEFDPHAETDPPDPLPPVNNATSELREEDLEESRDPRYLPGDPMGPQTQPAAARAPMLRYDDSIPRFSRSGSNEKKWLWIAAAVIVIACLGLVIVLASRMGH
ncbi:MAG TPA: zinc ribbon domain-containing protein [Polyangiales bacterium]|nr:zinc ribbon domain-containing protein [Polyangiales bacterium]